MKKGLYLFCSLLIATIISPVRSNVLDQIEAIHSESVLLKSQLISHESSQLSQLLQQRMREHLVLLTQISADSSNSPDLSIKSSKTYTFLNDVLFEKKIQFSEPAIQSINSEIIFSKCHEPTILNIGKYNFSNPSEKKSNEYWFELNLDLSDTFSISTVGSRDDLKLELFEQSCNKTPLIANDDAIGLHALIHTPPKTKGNYFLKVSHSAAKSFNRFSLTVKPQDHYQHSESDNKGTVNLGILRGTLLNDDTQEPISDTRVKLYRSNGQFYTSTYTDNSGRFVFNLPADSYFLITGFSPYSRYIDTSYPDIACPAGIGYGCQLSDLNLIELSEEQLIENLDIRIKIKPILSGTVIDTIDESPIRAVNVAIFDQDGNQIQSSNTSHEGTYAIAVSEPGVYYIKASHSRHYDELFNDINCDDGCDVTSGTAIVTTYGSNFENLDFSLNAYPEMKGTLIDGDSGDFIVTNLYMDLYDELNNIVQIQYVHFTEFGEWSLGSIKPGNYKIISQAYGYLYTLYDSMPCSERQIDSCEGDGDIINHTQSPSSVTLSQLTGGTVSGRVLDYNNQPVENALVELYFSYDYGIRQTVTNQNGNYEFSNLLNRDYYILARSDYLQDELYPDLPCSQGVCDYTSGTQITVENYGDITGIDFQLNPTQSISGIVLDDYGIPLANANIEVKHVNSSSYYYIPDSVTDNSGEFTLENVEQGTYKVNASKNGYVREVFDNIPCNYSNCIEPDFTPVTIIDNDITGIDFSLSKQPTIRVIINSNSVNPVEGGRVYVHNMDESTAASSFLHFDSENNYYFAEFSLRSGSYYFVYRNFSNPVKFVSKVYGGSNCLPTCELTGATLVTVENNTDYEINMDIDEHFYVTGIVNTTVPPISFPRIQSYNTELALETYVAYTGEPYRLYFPDLDSRYIKAILAGFNSEIFDSIHCVDDLCNIDQGQLITPSFNTSLNIDFNLSHINGISGYIRDIENNPIPGIQVRLLNSDNIYSGLATTYSDSSGEYFFQGVPEGNYYLLALDQTGNYVSTFNGSVICPTNDSNCVNDSVQLITIVDGTIINNENIHLQQFGTLSGENIFDIDNNYVSAYIQIYKVLDNGELSYVESSPIMSNGTLPEIKLLEGSYKIVAKVDSYYNNPVISVYPSGICEQTNLEECAENSSTLTVNFGENTHFDGYLIHRPGILKLSITDRTDGTPVSSMVKLYRVNEDLNSDFEGFSNSDGRFERFIDNGEYYLYINPSHSSSQGFYYNYLYGATDCNLGIDCLLSEGLPVSVANDSTTELEISLKPKPKLLINVLDPISGENQSATVKLYNSNMQEVSSNSSSDNTGVEVSNLLPGDYFIIAASNNPHYSYVAYPNVICTDLLIENCIGQPTLYTLGEGGGTLNLFPWSLNSIYGYVIDQETDLPLEGIVIDIWYQDGGHRGTYRTSSNGGFSFLNLQTETNYYLSTDTSNQYFDEVYENVYCETPSILGECPAHQLGVPLTIPQNNIDPVILEWQLTSEDEIFTSGFDIFN